MVAEHLAQAERHAAEGEKHVGRQRELVAQLTDEGHDTEMARALLIRFEELQALHIADCKRLRAELVALK